MATRGKRLQKVAEKYDRDSLYAVGDAVKIVKDAAADTKFDETVEIAINLGVCLLYTSPSPRDRG